MLAYNFTVTVRLTAGGKCWLMAVLRRLLVLAVLFVWQGGFTFYSAVVIEVGQEVLGSHRQQGFITRRVTRYLNVAGAVALPVLVWDMAACRDPSVRRRRARWAACAGLGLTLGLLAWLHPLVDSLLDPDELVIRDRGVFRDRHSWYLQVSTVQWVCALAYGILTVAAWRSEDLTAGAAQPNERSDRREPGKGAEPV